MDPITMLSVIGSVASVISLFKGEQRPLEPEAITQIVIQNSERHVVDGQYVRRESILDKASENEIRNIARGMISISMSPVYAAYYKRIEKCLAEYTQKIDDVKSSAESADAVLSAAGCICDSIKRIAEHKGSIPADLHELYNSFKC